MKRVLSTIALVTIFTATHLFAAPGLKVTVSVVDPNNGNPNWSGGIVYDLVMWIMNGSSAFVKTFGYWGTDQGVSDMPIWSSVNGNVKTTDGTTGATPTANATLSATWNLKNSSSVRVANGTYRYCIELNNIHSTVAAYQGYYVTGHIAIDSSNETKVGVDSSVHNGSTYLTTVTAEYTDGTSAVAMRSNARGVRIGGPSEFIAPAGYSGTAALRLFASNGELIWQKMYRTSAGESIRMNVSELKAAQAGYTGAGILVADFGARKIAKPVSLVW